MGRWERELNFDCLYDFIIVIDINLCCKSLNFAMLFDEILFEWVGGETVQCYFVVPLKWPWKDCTSTNKQIRDTGIDVWNVNRFLPTFFIH